MGVVVPWLGLILAGGGRPYDLGFRRPNRVGWRVLFVGYVVSVPFLVWMARGSDFAAYYLPQLRRAPIPHLDASTLIELVRIFRR